MHDANEEDIAEVPPFPMEWEAHQRVAAYWHAIHFTHLPSNTAGWYTVWKSLERERERRNRIKQETQ
jgi:hypothetical protein